MSLNYADRDIKTDQYFQMSVGKNLICPFLEVRGKILPNKGGLV